MTPMKKLKTISVLSIAGFDGSGGAGIQADTKTISALGCYATNVLTALPIQNTQGVRNIFEISPKAIEEQLRAIFDDIYPDAIKIGMVHNTTLVNIIADFLKDYTGKIVFDPVMVSTSGHRLIDEDTITACIEKLFPLVDIITPNLDEVAVLVGNKIATVEQMEVAGKSLLNMGCQSVLVKGGHLDSDVLTSLLVLQNEPILSFHTPKIATPNTHGSGCTLSSAIATFLAQKYTLKEAVGKALNFVNEAIFHSKDLIIGQGNGPLNHLYAPQKLITYEISTGTKPGNG